MICVGQFPKCGIIGIVLDDAPMVDHLTDTSSINRNARG